MKPAARARLYFKIHRWTGLLTGLFILFLSVTGAALVFIHEIEAWMHPDLMRAERPGATATHMVDADVVLRRVMERWPEIRVGSIAYPLDERSVYTVTVGRLEGESFNQVMVDPWTARIRGTRDYQSSLAFVLRQLHLRFYAFGWQGRVVVGLFGVVLVVSSITGLLIYGRFIRALPHWWSIRRERGFQISTSDWHKLVGITALAFNLVIAVTGAVLGLENLSRYSPDVGHALHPRPPAGAFPAPPESLDGAIPIARAVSQARRAIPGFVPVAVTLPRAGRSHYVLRGNLDGRIAMEGATSAGVHVHTGDVFYRIDARRVPVVTKAYNWMDPLHFGNWGGVWSKLLYVVLGLTTAFLSISGFLVWYVKTRRPAWAKKR